MTSQLDNSESIFIVGGTGSIGQHVVRSLLNRGIKMTIYIRDLNKLNEQFKIDFAKMDSHIQVCLGDYNANLESFEKNIKGHKRLFLLISSHTLEDPSPLRFAKIKEEMVHRAYKENVQQVVDISCCSVTSFGNLGLIGYMHKEGEEALFKLAKQYARALTILRPAHLMSNQLYTDIRTVKENSTIRTCGYPNTKITWVDTKDVADCAVNILLDPIDKHDRCVYEIGGHVLTNEERADLFSRVLKKKIDFEKESFEDSYDVMVGTGCIHGTAYDAVMQTTLDYDRPTPYMALLLKRPLRTLDQWLEENKHMFQ